MSAEPDRAQRRERSSHDTLRENFALSFLPRHVNVVVGVENTGLLGGCFPMRPSECSHCLHCIVYRILIMYL